LLPALAITCTGSYLHYCIAPAVYESRARLRFPGQVWLADAPAENRRAGGIPPAVLTSAIELLRSRGLAVLTGPAFDSDLETLRQQVSATIDQQPGCDLVTLRYRTREPDEAEPVLRAVVDAWLQRHRKAVQRQAAVAVAAADFEKTDRQHHLCSGELAELRQELKSIRLDEASHAVAIANVRTHGTALAEARLARVEAENRYLQVKRDLDAGLPPDVVAARIPGDAARTLIDKLLKHSQQETELRQCAAEIQQASAVYGPKHPRMVELKQKNARLTTNLAQASVVQQAGGAAVSPAELLLKSLESELTERRQNETDLQHSLQQAKASLERIAELREAVAEHEKELQDLETKRTALARHRDELKEKQAAKMPSVIDSPTLDLRPATPCVRDHALAAGILGLALGGVGLLFLPRKPRRRQ
jgi:hypothetical protein